MVEKIFEKQDLPSYFHFIPVILVEVILPAVIQHEVYLRLSVSGSSPLGVNPQFMEWIVDHFATKSYILSQKKVTILCHESVDKPKGEWIERLENFGE
jgi:hypothetical protein